MQLRWNFAMGTTNIPESWAFQGHKHLNEHSTWGLRQLPSPLVWWAVTCPVSRFDINELGNKAGSAASFSPIMKFLSGYHVLTLSCSERTWGSQVSFSWSLKMNLHKASHGFSRGIHEFVASLAGAVRTGPQFPSRVRSRVGVTGSHGNGIHELPPGRSSAPGCICRAPWSTGTSRLLMVLHYLHCGLKRRSAMDQYILHEYMWKLYVYGYG
jgi:hypothetical protein